ncbi:uncharacterized protein PGTG_15769 [Puccinia graminis f. sp. tritici CRL 75-36-700-3]|uniref:MTHFR SAM-binding regulatory domain-containing protein n=1 Tax=Puccinia graminis f. sp. tritici (strain CRL 75-36-700-3 / race SCCL) TaxID=418459 RepID=E3KZT2_PUCGT|nr:uncharacterized protein PGTG_15769 [Puccinia graminis f. sp. tritici CRL 75-36-700-3]EFP89813.2 hypothetical protein PGTG_15769 [Puccinia graminis f. sp. tritici CRL 75-36-700-3]
MAKKVVQLIESLKEDQVYFTFEYFPPKTIDGLSNLYARIQRMANLKPSCAHVTWGASGSTSDTSLEIAAMVQDQLAIPACLHLTCTNIQRTHLDQTLAQAKESGIVNILALRGDPPRGTEHWIPTDHEFQHAIDLVKYIRKEHQDHFCIGVAAYPEGTTEFDQDQELNYLKQKVDAGADFVVTQLFYDVDIFLNWVKACRNLGINVPIIPGIMPIQSYDGFRRLTALCKTNIPESIHSKLIPIKGDDQAVRDYGVELSTQMIKRLQVNGFKSFHLCTLNLERSITRLVNQLGWSPGGIKHCQPLLGPSVKIGTAEIVQGGLSVGWDEFPNGRFGDQRSPAFGLREGYSSSLTSAFSHLTTDVHALWGTPTSLKDITQIFCAFTQGKLPSTPWSEEPLALETSSITPFLLKLNQNGWWTVGSQPAIDGADSLDSVVGFGPQGGRVYQKSFVEFFVPHAHLEGLLSAVDDYNKEHSDGVAQLRYYAGNCNQDQIRSNMAPGETNAVTWGVFRGAEVVTTTLIEAQSFKTWKKQAFEIWNDWAESFEPNSANQRLLNQIEDSYWLCSLIDHDFKQPEHLWSFLIAHQQRLLSHQSL